MTENLKINVFDNLENYTEQEIVNGYPLPENVGLIKVAAIGLAQTPVKDILAAEEIPDTGGLYVRYDCNTVRCDRFVD